MKKLPVAILIFVMIFSLFTACGKNDTGSANTINSSDKPETSDIAQEDSPTEMGELELVFGGLDISLPITTVEELIAHGWEPFNEASAARLEKTLNPKERTFLILIKGDSYYIIIDVANFSDDVISTRQSVIICINDSMEENMLELPSGIVQGVSTRGELLTAYGEPDREPNDMYLFYDMEGFWVSIVVSPEETDVLGMIDIRFKDFDDFRFVALD